MRTFWVSALALSLAPLLFGADNAQRIAGVVVDHLSRHPLPNVLVTVQPAEREGDAGVGAVLTDSAGRFAFANVSAGKYRLVAEKRSGWRQLYLQTHDFSSAIVTGPGRDTEHLVVNFETPASISGVVTDAEGEQVDRGQVSLYRRSVTSGRWEIQLVRIMQIESNGRFVFSGLHPGTYFVAAQAQVWYQGFWGPPSTNDRIYPVTYFRDTSEARAAAPIPLAEGAHEQVAINVRAVAASRLILSTVPISPDHMPRAPQPFRFRVFAEGPGGTEMSIPPNMMSSVDGNMMKTEIVGIPPGHYILSGPDGSAEVDLAQGVSTTAPALRPGSLSGKVVGSAGDAKFDGNISLNFSCSPEHSVKVADDGTFATPPGAVIKPGRCRVSTQAHNVRLRSVMANAKLSPGNEFDVPPGAELQLMIHASKVGEGVKLTGVALTDGQARPGAMILLLPRAQSRIDLIRRDQSDSDGSFELKDVEPGQYLVVGIDDGSEIAYQEPDSIRPYMDQATSIEVPKQADSPIQVNVQKHKQ